MLEDISPNPFTLPSSTPAVLPYTNLLNSTQFAKNNFVPKTRQLKRTVSAQENESSLKWTLKKYWGYNDFRGPQLQICLSVMSGCDVLAVAPTGIGKSICFQVPAVTIEYGITIVVSPLLALMNDQVKGLRERGIQASMLYEKSDVETKKYVQMQLGMGHPKLRLLYVTPETLFSPKYVASFENAYRQKQLVRLVVDEAHVIEEWGLTFRAAYRDLGKFREKFKDVPVTAVTASATEDIRNDIIDILKIKKSELAQWVQPFNRKNLFYEVRYRSDGAMKTKENDIADFILSERPKALKRNTDHGITSNSVSGLVYCRARTTCDNVAYDLRQRGIKARAFHAQLSDTQRHNLLGQWKDGQIECIVATIAFGMGVDQAHVRYVIHYDMPKSFEGYYQETGRAGRDGHLSRCILYYSREDASSLHKLISREAEIAIEKQRKAKTASAPVVVDEDNLSRAKVRCINSFKLLQQYAEAVTTCRHIAICRYFGEKIESTAPGVRKAYCDNMCDVCSNPGAVMRRSCQINDEVAMASQVVRPKRPIREESTLQIPARARATSQNSIMDIHSSVAHVSSDPPKSDPVVDPEVHLDLPVATQPSRPDTIDHNVSDKIRDSPDTHHDHEAHENGTMPSSENLLPARKRNLPPSEIRQPARTSITQNATPGPSRPSRSAFTTPTTRPRTVDTYNTGEGSTGITAKRDMDPKKREKEHKALMAVQPIPLKLGAGGGPFPCYGNGVGRGERSTTPGTPSASFIKPFRPPLMTPSRPTPVKRIRVDDRDQALASTRPERIRVMSETLEKVFRDDEASEAVWRYWGRTELGATRKRVLKKVAKRLNEDFEAGIDVDNMGNIEGKLQIVRDAIRILSTADGIAFVLDGKLAEYRGAGDVHGDVLLSLDEMLNIPD